MKKGGFQGNKRGGGVFVTGGVRFFLAFMYWESFVLILFGVTGGASFFFFRVFFPLGKESQNFEKKGRYHKGLFNTILLYRLQQANEQGGR